MSPAAKRDRQPAPTAAATNLRVIQAYRQGDATPTAVAAGRPQADHHTTLERGGAARQYGQPDLMMMVVLP